MGEESPFYRKFSGYIENYRPFSYEEEREFGARIDKIGKDASALELKVQMLIPGYSPRSYASPPIKFVRVQEYIEEIMETIKTFGNNRETRNLKSRLVALNKKLEDTAQEFALNNMNLVPKYSKKYALKYHEDESNLESEFNETLFRAIRAFDFSRGIKFSTYCIGAFNMASLKYSEERKKMNSVIVPEGPKDLLAKVNSDGRISPDKECLLRVEGGKRLKTDIEGFLEMLDPREAIVIRNRFLGDKNLTLKEIGPLIGVTRERVRQVQIRALAKLKEIFEEHGMVYIAEALA